VVFEKTYNLHLERDVVHDLEGVLFIQQHGYVPFYVSKDDFSPTNSGVQIRGHTDIIVWDYPQNVKIRALEDTVVVVGMGSINMSGQPSSSMTAEELGALILTAKYPEGEERIIVVKEDGTIVLEDRLTNVVENEDDEITIAEAQQMYGLSTQVAIGNDTIANVVDSTTEELTDLEAMSYWLGTDTEDGYTLTFTSGNSANVEESTVEETTTQEATTVWEDL